jgi:hypothetical protein
MSEFLTMFTTFFGTFLSLGGDVIDFITSNPIILIGVMLAVGTIVFGVVKRFIPGLR